jgi:Ca2+-binding EF-hand superfamily protein
MPVKIKKDKNKSEDVYFVLNSNKRGAAQNREEILAALREDNDNRHLSKIMTLIAIKIEEKFHSLAKAFLFFDIDGDQTISRTEFHKGIEGLRVKLSNKDIDQVFYYMDKDQDANINYKEFCGFSEEKRRNIDPFDSIDTQQRMAKHMGLNDQSLA